MLHFGMAKNPSRRTFLRAAPLAALPFAGQFLISREAHAASAEPFQLISAEQIADSLKALQATPGQQALYQPQSLPITVALFAESKKAAGEFEYHEGRDHIFLILDGAAKFELGGTPKTPRNTKPGEWLAPDSAGASPVEVKKGDMLLVPRGTPHRQSTETSVQWMLISSTGTPKA